MKKRALGVFLSVMMAASVLVGCSDSKKEAEKGTEKVNEMQKGKDSGTEKEPSLAAELGTEISWPENPIQIIVGANAGGGIDTAARLIAKYMEKELGQPMVVSNVAGGAGSIASNQVKDSKTDGYTMLVCHEALLTNKISEVTDFDYDGFASGGIPFKVYTTCLLSKKYSSFDELKEAAKANPGTVKFGTELATNDTAIIAMMEEAFDLQYQLVDAGAVSDQIAAMMGDHIDFMKAPVGLVKDYVASGDFHVLAFFNEERNSDYPEVPTMKELGVDFVVDKFFFCGFPKDTDPAIIDKFAKALERVCENPDFQADAKNVQYAVEYVAPEDTDSYFEECKVRLQEYQDILDHHYQ
ncbi:MAG: tripartite tricarboxylate transporter substrate binding protein [Lachnospiraceae bacterium]|jgi:tripartite-type tricarboxylate transporter receptor subunit TctC|nr:tripartite tricarboxylate transporter substrate binding protein [Lachnospiraceae bacterium]